MLEPLPRLSDVISNDELRPALSHVWMTQDYIVASNAHILVELRTEEHFEKSFLLKIPKDGYYLDIYTLRALQKKNIVSVDIINIDNSQRKMDVIEIYYKYGEKVLFELKTSLILGAKYPDYQSLLRSYEDPKNRNEINNVSVNARLMNNLQRGIGDDVGIKMFFTMEVQNGGSAIYCVPKSFELLAQHRHGLLMTLA